MIYCGVDIIEISRIKESIEKYENSFLDKVYTKNEIEYCEKYKSNKYEHYAARFSGKEALYKSLSNICQLSWKDVEILNSKTGRPYVKFVEENLKEKLSPEIIGRLKNAQIDITLSHNKSQAIAYVVVSI